MSSDDDRWRLLQTFLSPHCAVFEVEINTRTIALRCSCPGYAARRACKHVRYAQRRVHASRHEYCLDLVHDVDSGAVARAYTSAAAFRKFIVDHGRIEVL